TVQQAAVQQRQATEGALKGSPPTAGPRTAAMKVPAARTVSTLPAAAAASPQNPGNRPNPQVTGSTPNAKAAPAAGGAAVPAGQHPTQGAGQTPQTAAKPASPGTAQTGQLPGSAPNAAHAPGLQQPQTAGQAAGNIAAPHPGQTPGTAPAT